MIQISKSIQAILLGVGLILAGLAGRALLNEREDRVRLDAELKATGQLLQAKDQELSRLDRGMKERDQQTAEMVKKIEELKARPATIREIVREMPQYIPFEKPPELVPPIPSAPEAPPQIGLDESQVQDLRKFYLDCHRATLELQACQENAKDWKAKEITWQEKEQILVQQREAAIRAVKGGSFWTRFSRNGKWFLVGGAVGGATVAILRR